jgi:hypothetical protein
MIIPSKLPPQYPLGQLRQWLNQLRDAVQSQRLSGDGQSIRVNSTPAGSTISAVRSSDAVGGSSAAGSSLSIAKVVSRTGSRAYTVDIFSRWESNWSVSNTYRTETGAVMQTPTLDDTATADRLVVGTILLVTQANIAGTTVYVPAEHIGLF